MSGYAINPCSKCGADGELKTYGNSLIGVGYHVDCVSCSGTTSGYDNASSAVCEWNGKANRKPRVGDLENLEVLVELVGRAMEGCYQDGMKGYRGSKNERIEETLNQVRQHAELRDLGRDKP